MKEREEKKLEENATWHVLVRLSRLVRIQPSVYLNIIFSLRNKKVCYARLGLCNPGEFGCSFQRPSARRNHENDRANC